MENSNITQKELMNELQSLRNQTFEFLKEQVDRLGNKINQPVYSHKSTSEGISNDYYNKINGLLFDISFHFSDEPTTELALKIISQRFADILNISTCIIYLFERSKDGNFTFVSSDENNTIYSDNTLLSNLLVLYQQLITHQIVETESENIEQEIIDEILAIRDIKSLCAIPLIGNQNRLYGFISVEDENCIREFSDDELTIFEKIASEICKNIDYLKTLNKFEDLRHVINNSDAVLLEIDNDPAMTVSYISENIVQFGYTPHEFISGNIRYDNIILDEDREYYLERIKEATESYSPSLLINYRILNSYNIPIWVEHHITIMRDNSGEVLEYIGFLEDISERKKIETELATKSFELEVYGQSLRELGKITSYQYENTFDLIQAYLSTGCRIFKLKTGILAEIKNNEYIIKNIFSEEQNFSVDDSLNLDETLCSSTYSENKATIYSDIDEIREFRNHPVYLTFGLRSYIGIPITINNKLWGTLSFSSKDVTEFISHNYIQDILSLLAQNIENSIEFKLKEDQKRLTERLLTDKNALLTTLFSNLEYGFLVEDELRKILHVSNEFCRMFDISIPPKFLSGTDSSKTIEFAKVLFKDSEGFVEGINRKIESQTEHKDEILELVDGKTFLRSYFPITASNSIRGHLWIYKNSNKNVNSEMIKTDTIDNIPNTVPKVDEEILNISESLDTLFDVNIEEKKEQTTSNSETIVENIPMENSPIVENIIENEVLDLSNIWDRNILAGMASDLGENEETFMNDMLVTFISDSDSKILQFAESFFSNDYTEAANLAHSLEGSATNIGALKVAATALELEKSCKIKEFNAISNDYGNLNSAFQEFKDCLTNLKIIE